MINVVDSFNCTVNTCENNSTCIVKKDNSYCECVDEYTGIYCEYKKLSQEVTFMFAGLGWVYAFDLMYIDSNDVKYDDMLLCFTFSLLFLGWWKKQYYVIPKLVFSIHLCWWVVRFFVLCVFNYVPKDSNGNDMIVMHWYWRPIGTITILPWIIGIVYFYWTEYNKLKKIVHNDEMV